MGKYTVCQINENTRENDDKSTADIVNITLVSVIVRLPIMGDNLLNDIIHNMSPTPKTPNDGWNDSQKGKGDKIAETISEQIAIKEGAEKGNNIGNHR